jgi:hypothetical protein
MGVMLVRECGFASVGCFGFLFILLLWIMAWF